MHSKETVHRDIKWSNIFLVKDGSIKLGDFNLSEISKRESSFEKQSEISYTAGSEMRKRKLFDYKNDIWSLGWILYEMATFSRPSKTKFGKSKHIKLIYNN